MKSFFIFAFLALAMILAMGQVPIAHGVDISAVIPNNGSNAGTSSPGGYVNSFYQFALLVGGVLALAVVVYGGISYMTSVGNPSGQSEAKAWIEAALFGILLLAGAYLVLKIINPQLVNLSLPTLQPTGTPVNQTTVTATQPSGSSGSTNSNVNAAAIGAGVAANAFVPGSGAAVTQVVQTVGNVVTSPTTAVVAATAFTMLP